MTSMNLTNQSKCENKHKVISHDVLFKIYLKKIKRLKEEQGVAAAMSQEHGWVSGGGKYLLIDVDGR